LEAVIDNESDYSKLQRALDDLQATRSKLQQLEAWVKNNLPAP
jgi:PHD/YefM family antitoxin component YafN of YafNO toxin-antitoxin module